MSRYFRLLPLAVALGAAAAAAQSPTAAPPSWRPPLAGYQPFTDEKVVSWKDANDNVGRIGGWREYARENQQQGGSQATPAAPASSAPAGTPAGPAGHGGHSNH